MSPRRANDPIWPPPDPSPPKGRVRRAVDEIVGDTAVVLVFSAIAAIPMRLIFGSWTPWTFFAGAILTAAVYLQSAGARRRKRKAARRWVEAGWVDTPPRTWPWDGRRGLAQVRFAKDRVVRGFPVSVVEAFWVDGGVGGAATAFSGSGTIVVVRLPRPHPPLPDTRPGYPSLAGDELYAVVEERPFPAYSATRRQRPPRFRPISLADVPAQVERVLAVVDSLGPPPAERST
jgi:hypothetical protein